MTEPKPCCGPRGPRPWWQHLDLLPIKSWRVLCGACGRETQWWYRRDEAVAAWNQDDLFHHGVPPKRGNKNV